MADLIKSISLYGQKKTGKTSFGFSCPKKLLIFDFESGVSRVEPRFTPNPDTFTVKEFAEPILTVVKKDRPAVAKKQWDELLKLYNDALEGDEYETIIFDTFTAVWELCRNAYLAELGGNRTSLLQIEYGEANRRMKKLLVQGRLHNKLVVCTHHTRDKYKANMQGESVPTGELEPDGFKYTGDLVDVVVYFSKEKKNGVMIPKATIQDCGLCMAAEGLDLASPTYEDLEQLIKNVRQ